MARRRRRIFWACGAAICGLAGALIPAAGADIDGADASWKPVEAAGPLNGWSVSLTPYGWFTFLTGRQTVRGRTVDIDANPIQVLEHLGRMPWFSYLEARKGRLSFYNDAMYAKLDLKANVVKTVTSRFDGTLGASLGVSFEQAIVETGATYELARWEQGGGGLKDLGAPQSFTAIDILAGARYWHQDMDLSFSLAGTLDLNGLAVSGTHAIARSGSVDWVDPLVGVRVRRQLEPGRELVLRADAGGFGAGSQFSWNALAAYSWEIVRHDYLYSGYIGYRALQVDFVEGAGRAKYEYDVIQHGPVAGLTVHF